MPSDHQQALERIVAAVRESADAALRSHAEGVAGTVTDELKRAHEAQLAALREAMQRLELTRNDLESRLAASERSLAELRARVEEDVAAARAAAAAAQAQLENLRARLAQFERETAVPTTGATTLAAALRSLDEAGSLGDALGRLFDGAATLGAERVALMLSTGEALTAWRGSGFDRAPEGASTSRAPGAPEWLPPADAGAPASILTMAHREARAVVQPRLEGSSPLLPSFARGDRSRAAAASPVVVSGNVVAVVYADAAATDGDAAPDWCHGLEALARHAGRLLESLTIQLAVRAAAGAGTTPPAAPPGAARPSGGVG